MFFKFGLGENARTNKNLDVSHTKRAPYLQLSLSQNLLNFSERNELRTEQQGQ